MSETIQKDDTKNEKQDNNTGDNIGDNTAIVIEDNDTKNPERGWSFEHDELLSNWGDKAACYTWMHDATQRKFRTINMRLGIPIIVLSTISGTANFGISTIFPTGFAYGNAVIGTLSLITGVISTISNFLGYAQSEEAHRISSIQWSKFKRTIETELSMHPSERKNASEFVKYARSELDRLMEQNPTIPQDIIDKFIKTFKKVKNIKMPENCNKLEPTTVYSELYNAKIAAEVNNNKHVDTEINTTDKQIISSVTSKINSLDSKNDDVVLNINAPEEIIQYSNTVKDEVVTPVAKTAFTPVVTMMEKAPPIRPLPKNPLEVKSKILPKQIVYGKK